MSRDERLGRIAEIRARLAATTPGTWPYIVSNGISCIDVPGVYCDRMGVQRGRVIWTGGTSYIDEQQIANGRFCAHAHDDVAWLLEQITSLIGEADEQY